MNAILTTVQGNATGAASIYKFEDGGCRATVTIAVNDTYFDPASNQWKERKPEFVRVQIRRKSLAENVVKCVRKGQPLLVSGRMVTRTWTDRDGGERQELLLHADSVGIELTYGTAEYMKSAPVWVDEATGELRGDFSADASLAATDSSLNESPAEDSFADDFLADHADSSAAVYA